MHDLVHKTYEKTISLKPFLKIILRKIEENQKRNIFFKAIDSTLYSEQKLEMFEFVAVTIFDSLICELLLRNVSVNLIYPFLDGYCIFHE